MTRPAINKFAYTTVTAVVIANMVGTGVFTSLGFQLLELRSGCLLYTSDAADDYFWV